MAFNACYLDKNVKDALLDYTVKTQKIIPDVLNRKKKKVIVISGPTGTGKSNLAINICKTIGAEVISADSMQVYRGMDIGTAKVSKAQRLEVPHHLIDIREIYEEFNVVDFCFEAKLAIEEVINRGNVPIVVGGSGFYLHALLYGPPSGPPSIPELRQFLEEEFDRLGFEHMYQKVVKMDPDYAKSITKNDKQKIVRAIEIMTITKKRVSDLPWKRRRNLQNFDFRCWFLDRPKESLYKLVEERCDLMLQQGLVQEVKDLVEAGLLQNHSAMQAIGYRQVLEFIDGPQTELDMDKLSQEFKKATKKYIKRQHTWFKKEPLFRWIDIDAHESAFVMDQILNDFEIR